MSEAAEQPNPPEMLPEPIERRALLEAIIYVAEEPLTAQQIAQGLGIPLDVVQADLDSLVEESRAPGHGVEIRVVAGGYKMSTKAEHHDAVRKFVKSIRPKLRLSLPALETLAVIAYKQPVTLPEIQEIRGVNASAVIHTLLNHKLVTTAGRKQVIGKPMLYKTTKEFLVHFGLNDLSELPSMKELEELSRAVLGDGEEDPNQPEVGPEEAADAPSEDRENAAATEEVSRDREETGTAEAAVWLGDGETLEDPQPGAEEESVAVVEEPEEERVRD